MNLNTTKLREEKEKKMKHPQFYVHQICLQAMLLSSLPLDPHYPHHPLDPTVLKPHHPTRPHNSSRGFCKAFVTIPWAGPPSLTEFHSIDNEGFINILFLFQFCALERVWIYCRVLYVLFNWTT